MGPILEEFKTKRNELIANLHKICNDALQKIGRKVFDTPPPLTISAQGGISTVEEDRFLKEHYQLDETGWATPFLLAPEVTNVDEDTLKKLVEAQEEDLFLSDVSPLQVPFNTISNSNSELEKKRRIKDNRPGSPCPKGYLVSDREFTEKPICLASRQYQHLKLKQLKEMNLPQEEHDRLFAIITDKTCICADLGQGPLINHGIGDVSKRFTAVCPGPNLAYFSKIFSLKELVDHIYGRTNILNDHKRPHMFMKELQMYVDFFFKEVKKIAPKANGKQMEYLNNFRNNLLNGIEYYKKLFPEMLSEAQDFRQKAIEELQRFTEKLEQFVKENQDLFPPLLSPSLARSG